MKRIVASLIFLSVSSIGCWKSEKPLEPLPAPVKIEPAPAPRPAIKIAKVVIHFDFNSHTISLADKKAIRKAFEAVKEEGGFLSIEAYADSQGSSEYNKDLTEKRAAAVAKYLKAIRVKPDNMFVKGLGESNLLNADKTVGDHKINRRADITWMIWP